jgi:hypothetical protein
VVVLPLPLTLIVQLLPVTAPVKVIVPSDARLDMGRPMTAATPAAVAALLIQIFMSPSANEFETAYVVSPGRPIGCATLC